MVRKLKAQSLPEQRRTINNNECSVKLLLRVWI